MKWVVAACVGAILVIARFPPMPEHRAITRIAPTDPVHWTGWAEAIDWCTISGTPPPVRCFRPATVAGCPTR
ncbi:MAG TPA: hypothetical protein VF795_00830 [Desulfuromonadaceae bacterium]